MLLYERIIQTVPIGQSMEMEIEMEFEEIEYMDIEIPDTEITNLTKTNEQPEAREAERNPQETININLNDLRY